MTDPLRDALAARAVALSQRVLDRMYENPFWMERYGERGRRFANEDSLHHISFLDQALAAGEPGVFERYAQWLRTVLVSRGMCSEHLAENFRLLAEAIAGDRLPDASRAATMLSMGADSLRYAEGNAGALEEVRLGLIEAVRGAAREVSLREDDCRYLVSYLIDAAATGNHSAYEDFAARFPAGVCEALTTAARRLPRDRPAGTAERPAD